MEPRLVFRRDRMIVNHCTKRNNRAFRMVLRIVFHKVFSHLPRGLEHFADGNSIPYNQSTIFHPDQIATVLQKSLPKFCALSQQCHLSRIDGVLRFDDSMKNLHWICQFPVDCQCTRLSAFPVARETSVSSLRCTDKIDPLNGLILYHD